MRRRVTFSRNVTLSLSRTCVSHCKYCAFATHQPHLHTPDEVERLIDGAAKSTADDFFKRFDAEMQRRYGPAPAEGEAVAEEKKGAVAGFMQKIGLGGKKDSEAS